MKNSITILKRASLAAMLATTMFTASAANVVTDWNTIASTTIVRNGGKSPGASAIWFTYSSLAMYDAVNAITGQYRPFYYQGAGPQGASIEAAAASAAHRILVNYFPAQQTDLDAALAASLAALNADQKAKDDGVAIGEAAAAAVISARVSDGLEAGITYNPGSGPGAWIPTPPAFAAPLSPWLAQFRPFTMSTAGDFLPDGPTPLGSEAWRRDFNLTRLLGGANSTIRSAAESEIGVFWTEHTAQQYSRSFNRLVDNYNLGAPDAARLMAMLWTGYADAVTACWNGKYKFGFWRPVTAVLAGGGNSDLAPDAAWLPLGATPPHPEYPSAHGCVTGAVSTVIAGYFGTTRVHFVADSLAFTDGVHTHTFEDTRDLMDEVFWARIYAGIHYYHSLEDGRDLGRTVARELLRNHFHPLHDNPEARVASRPR